MGWCTGACCIANLLLILITFLGIFSTINPDKEAWAGRLQIAGDASGGDESLASKQLYSLYPDRVSGEKAGATHLIDVHGRFLTWFGSGFLLSLTPLPIAITTLALHIMHAKLGKCVGGLSVCTVGCGFTAWWILGLFWRFSELGMYSSGEKPYQYSTGDGKETNTLIEWSYMGSEASNDSEINDLFQLRSGRFMKYFYIVSWAIQISAILVCIIMAFFGQCCCNCY